MFKFTTKNTNYIQKYSSLNCILNVNSKYIPNNNFNFFKYVKKYRVDYDPSKDYYKILEVSQTASEQELKIAYYKLAKKYHPDITGGKTTERFKEINTAYDVLSDKDKKLQYDASRKFGSFWGGKTYSQQQQQNRSSTGSSYTNSNNYNWGGFNPGGNYYKSSGYSNQQSNQNKSSSSQSGYSSQEDPFKGFNDWFKGFQDKYNSTSQKSYKDNFSSGKKTDFSQKYYDKNKDYFSTFKEKSEDSYQQKSKPKREAQFGKKYYEKNKKYYDTFKRTDEDSKSNGSYNQQDNYNNNHNNQQQGYNNTSNFSPFILFVISFAGVIIGSVLIRRIFGGSQPRVVHNPNPPQPRRDPPQRDRQQVNPSNQYQQVKPQQTAYSSYSPPTTTKSTQDSSSSSYSSSVSSGTKKSNLENSFTFERSDKQKSGEKEHGMKDDPFYRK